MAEYTELIADLRDAEQANWKRLSLDAAAAIEALQAENADIREELFISQRKYDEFTTIASMQNAMLAKQLPKRGEWVDGDARRVTARCSVCGHLRLGNGAEWANKHVHFCEVCGSKMGDEKA